MPSDSDLAAVLVDLRRAGVLMEDLGKLCGVSFKTLYRHAAAEKNKGRPHSMGPQTSSRLVAIFDDLGILPNLYDLKGLRGAAEEIRARAAVLRQETRTPPAAMGDQGASDELARLGRSKLGGAKKQKRVLGET